MNAAKALIVAPPLSFTDWLLGEFEYMLHWLKLRAVLLPLMLRSVTSDWSSANTQTVGLLRATARAWSCGVEKRNRLASLGVAVPKMVTSTAVVSVVWVPDAGGLWTVTVIPLLP